MSDTELNSLWRELERRRMQREQIALEQRAQSRADLIAAFGEADIAAAMALDLPEEPAKNIVKNLAK